MLLMKYPKIGDLFIKGWIIDVDNLLDYLYNEKSRNISILITQEKRILLF